MKPQPHSTAAPSRQKHTMAHFFARRTCLWAALGLLAVHAFVARPAQAAVTEAWVHRYGAVVSNSNDQAHKVVRDAAGDIIVTGTSDDGISGPDILTIKYSGADGSMLWQKRYNGPANNLDQARAWRWTATATWW